MILHIPESTIKITRQANFLRLLQTVRLIRYLSATSYAL